MTVTIIIILIAFAVAAALAYMGRGYFAWVSFIALGIFAWWMTGVNSPMAFNITLGVYLFFAILFGVPAIRRFVVSAPAMKMVASMLPAIGDTEKIALEAGTVWWDGDLFSGNPNWQKLIDFEVPELSLEEQKFMDGPVEELCAMIDDWEIYQARDLSPEVWDFIKKNKFMGMIIPKEYGGLGFSAAAHSAVITKLSSRSVTACITVMVPNSLGPGELLVHYGTKKQKDYYLPRLADGTDIPCFALTEPHAGSDAANGRSVGIVCKGMWEGKEVLGINLTFSKRYITLAPVASVVGLAFNLKDPDYILGDGEDIGITCALIPATTPGIKLGDRHDPLGVPFMNGPVEGKNIFVPIDFIIGGVEKAGGGWRMLMDSLASGRGISLPSSSTGAAEISCRAAGTYALVREQFGLPIGKFEGVREKLGRMAGMAYVMNAARKITASAIDAGEKPTVVSAIVKAYMTEGMRQSLTDAMDIHAGAGISGGPRNIFAHAYTSIPIGITVEGANILTRSLIVFGQGAIRCHPFAYPQVEAIMENNLKAADEALFGHVTHVAKNSMRAFFLGLSGGLALEAPVSGPEAKYYKRLTRMSSAFALIADFALMTLGGALKRKEYISGRLADAFAWMYLASTALKRFYDEGSPESERPLLDWVMAHALYQIESSLTGVLVNLPNRLAAGVASILAFPLGPRYQPPTDRQVDAAAAALLDDDGIVREMLSREIYIPHASSPGFGALEHALDLITTAGPAIAKVKNARKKGEIEKAPMLEMAIAARAGEIISDGELGAIKAAEEARDDVVQVDSFAPDVYKTLR